MDFNELVKGARTYRRFDGKPIAKEILHELVDNARISNSAMNAQVLRFVLISQKEIVDAAQDLIHWAGALPKGVGTPHEGEKPSAFIMICKEGKGNPWDDIDCGIAARTITLNAYAHGIGSAMLGAVDFKKLSEITGTPEDWHPRLLIALGGPGCESTLVDVPKSGITKYWIDEERNYYVPKKKWEEVVFEV